MKKYFILPDYLEDRFIKKETDTEIVYDFNLGVYPYQKVFFAIKLDQNKNIYTDEEFQIIMELYMPGEIEPTVKRAIYFPDDNHISITNNYTKSVHDIAKIRIYIKLIEDNK